MAWDREAGGFNYYRSIGDTADVDVRRELARRVREQPRQGRVPEPLERRAADEGAQDSVDPLGLPRGQHLSQTAFAKNDRRRTHEWFTGTGRGGAFTFEFAAARPAIDRWARARFDALAAGGGVDDRPGRSWTRSSPPPPSNLTRPTSRAAASSSSVLDLPPTFFVDSTRSGRRFACRPLRPSTSRAQIYAQLLEKFEVRLGTGRASTKGDTHFASSFPSGPSRTRSCCAMRSDRAPHAAPGRMPADGRPLEPDLLRPPRRPARATFPPTATSQNGSSGFSAEMANAILAAEGKGQSEVRRPSSPSAGASGTTSRAPFNRLLDGLLRGRDRRAGDPARLRRLLPACRGARRQLRERRRFRSPEFPLLLPQTNIRARALRMHARSDVDGG